MEGSASPGFKVPAVTAALICAISCSNWGRGSSMSMLICMKRSGDLARGEEMEMEMYQLSQWYMWTYTIASPQLIEVVETAARIQPMASCYNEPLSRRRDIQHAYAYPGPASLPRY